MYWQRYNKHFSHKKRNAGARFHNSRITAARRQRKLSNYPWNSPSPPINLPSLLRLSAREKHNSYTINGFSKLFPALLISIITNLKMRGHSDSSTHACLSPRRKALVCCTFQCGTYMGTYIECIFERERDGQKKARKKKAEKNFTLTRLARADTRLTSDGGPSLGREKKSLQQRPVMRTMPRRYVIYRDTRERADSRANTATQMHQRRVRLSFSRIYCDASGGTGLAVHYAVVR